MRTTVAAVALLGLLLAGCAAPDTPRQQAAPTTTILAPTVAPTSTSMPATASTAPPRNATILLSGTLHRIADGYSAYLSAYNAGPGNVTYVRYCYSASGAWAATLSGPPGDNLRYQVPARYTCSGSSSGYPMGPGEWVNWTDGLARAADCTDAQWCDNYWDGELADAHGDRAAAPPGNYTWTFAFHWVDAQDRSWAHPHSKSVALAPEVP